MELKFINSHTSYSNFGFSFLFLTGNAISLLIWEFLIWEAVLSLLEDLVFEAVTKNLHKKICKKDLWPRILQSPKGKDHLCHLQDNKIIYNITLRFSTTFKLSILYHVTL